MRQHFVTYEIAKKLADLGFNEECLSIYYREDFCGPSIGENGNQILEKNSDLQNDQLAAPLWQQAIDWLREKHKIEVTQTPSIELEEGWFNFEITRAKPRHMDFVSDLRFFEAREAAILKALELITK